MFIRQVSVFLENANGSLAALMRVLAENKIDLIALCIADTERFGILRCICKTPEEAVRALRGAGYTAKMTDVLAVAVDDEPGGLARAISLFDERGISVEYLYSFVRRLDGKALVILRPDDRGKAAQAVSDAGCALLTPEQLGTL